MKLGGGLRSMAAKRRGPNYKATCVFCGKGIANRMLYKVDGPGYAHQSCVKRYAPLSQWERTW